MSLPSLYCYIEFGLFRFRSPLLTESLFDFFSSPYLDVSVQAVPLIKLFIHFMMTDLPSAGFFHSDIHVSLPAYGSSWLFAVRCVLLRLPVPRHSPCALLPISFLYMCLQMLLRICFFNFSFPAFLIPFSMSEFSMCIEHTSFTLSLFLVFCQPYILFSILFIIYYYALSVFCSFSRYRKSRDTLNIQ